MANALAVLDVHAGLALWALESGATKPIINEGLTLDIEAGRHPVVEAALARQSANAVYAERHTAGRGRRRCASSGADHRPQYGREIDLFAPDSLDYSAGTGGLFVPAKRAKLGLVDHLFSRVGASDDLSKGRSTFMVEMIETAAILNQATERSFVILDEIGRGTATFDGLSIAWAAVEHLHAVNQCRTLFATHYNELTELVASLDGAQNFSLRAREHEGELIFLHDIKEARLIGPYGIQVAKLAGLPPAAVARARAVLDRLEADGTDLGVGDLPLFNAAPPAPQFQASAVEDALATIDADTLSPRDALIYSMR